jgi:hypothetical protein
MRDLKSLDIDDVDGTDHGMDGVLIMKILIELASATLIILIARSKLYASLHMMDTRPPPHGEFFQSLVPENDFSAFSGGRIPGLFDPLVFSSHVAHGTVKTTGRTIIVDAAIFARNDAGLHPDAGAVAILTFFLKSGWIHFSTLQFSPPYAWGMGHRA